MPRAIVPRNMTKIDNQTMHPAKHLRQNMKITAKIIASANDNNNHFQF
jgi:hypothetical protein